jgi:hypothetical protein
VCQWAPSRRERATRPDHKPICINLKGGGGRQRWLASAPLLYVRPSSACCHARGSAWCLELWYWWPSEVVRGKLPPPPPVFIKYDCLFFLQRYEFYPTEKRDEGNGKMEITQCKFRVTNCTTDCTTFTTMSRRHAGSEDHIVWQDPSAEAFSGFHRPSVAGEMDGLSFQHTNVYYI